MTRPRTTAQTGSVTAVFSPALQPSEATRAQTAATMARADFAVALIGVGIDDCKQAQTAGHARQVLGPGREAVTAADWIEAKGKLGGGTEATAGAGGKPVPKGVL